MSRRVASKLAFAVAMPLMTVSAAHAQQAANSDTDTQASPDEADAQDNGGDIVVTAMRRETSLQNVPASIAALSSSQLEKSGITDSGGLQYQVPGLMIAKDSGQQAQIYIRGVGNNLQGISAGNSVATYVDGVYVPNSIQVFQEFNDVERIEVLKGPQATLYGRNATGGAINIISSDPSFTASGKGDISFGNYNAFTARASINAPIVDDTLALRVSVQSAYHKGYNENIYLGQRMQGQSSTGVRAALRWKVSPDFEAILRADYSNSNNTDYLKIRNPKSWWYLISPVDQYVDDPRKVMGDVGAAQPIENDGQSLHLRWDTGIGTIKSVTSRRHFDSGPTFLDLDQVALPPGIVNGRPYQGSYLGDITASTSYYHETYLATDTSKPLRAILGFNYFHEDAREFQYQYAGGLSSYDRHGKTDAYSLFVDASLDVSPQFTISAGLRYSDEKRDYSQLRIIPAVPLISNKASWDSFSPRVGVEYRPNDDVLLYANATSGFKSGGFNLQNPLNPFKPEKIWSYEGGIKASLFDRKLRTSLSGFYYSYKDIQVSQTLANLQRVVTNAGTAKIWGLDAEGSWAATPELRLTFGLSLLHSEYGSAILCDAVIGPCASANAPALVDVKGNRLPRAPGTTGSIAVDYTAPGEVAGGELSLHLDAAYRSRTYWTPFEFKAHSVDPQWMTNAQVRYDRGNWYVAGYVQNIFDVLYVSNGIGSGKLSTANGLIGEPAVFDRYAAPRTYGIRIGFSY